MNIVCIVYPRFTDVIDDRYQVKFGEAGNGVVHYACSIACLAWMSSEKQKIVTTWVGWMGCHLWGKQKSR